MTEFSQYNVLREAVRAKLNTPAVFLTVKKNQQEIESNCKNVKNLEKITAIATSSNLHLKTNDVICIL